LEIISRNGEHLLTLINDVLSMAKVESGRMTLEVSDFDLRPMIEAIEQMFGPRAKAKALELTVVIEPSLPARVRGDETKLRQVLINLLGNAIKFTDRGLVALRVEWRNGSAAFAVEDTGVGIAADAVALLFQPFTQIAANDGAREGTGLGLAISDKFVRLMGGALHVQSVPGHGSIFSFAIPLSEVSADTAHAPQPRRRIVGLAPGQPTYRLLVADDTEENCMLLEELFTHVGLEVRTVTNGDEAVSVWHEWQPHLVWMDVRMPILDGCDATRAIRAAEAEGGRARTKVIALTASAFEHDRDTILAAGCDDFVAKPFLQATLFDALTRHLGLQWRYENERLPPAPAIATVPLRVRETLDAAIVRGDVSEAIRVAGQIEAEALRGRVLDLIRTYRFDDLQELFR
ncbi:MAG TPA: ATP-binding protein, partial [Thermoanaerobaculia bacterium]